MRTHSHRDRRVVERHSTEQVHAHAEAFFAPVAARLDAVLTDCSAEELAALRSLLGRLGDETRDLADG